MYASRGPHNGPRNTKARDPRPATAAAATNDRPSATAAPRAPGASAAGSERVARRQREPALSAATARRIRRWSSSPTDPSAITDAYPNYGGDVDCDADTWNGLPYTGTVKKISAPDPQTVVFELCGPNVAFLSILGFYVFSINDSDWLIQHSADASHLKTMNGTGAYKFDAWQRGTEIDYSRIDSYWGTSGGERPRDPQVE